MEDVAPSPGVKYYPLYEEYMERLVKEKQLQPDRAILKKGQALIGASNLLHGGAHTYKIRTRRSQVTHFYYFEGGHYYMPQGSYGDYRHLRLDLERIR